MNVSKMTHHAKALCTPAKVYWAVALFAWTMRLSKLTTVVDASVQLALLGAWAWVLGWLCRKGYKAVSWVLVVAPFLFAFAFVMGVVRR